MRQCGAVNDVADGIYAFDIRTVEVVYCYFVALERDARLFETESFEVRLDADCRKDDVGRKYLFAFFPFDAEFAFSVAVYRHVFHRSTGHDAYLHLPEGAFERFADVGIGGRKQLRQVFDNRYLHSERGIEIGELAADGTRTDYGHAFGKFPEDESLFGGDDFPAVDRHELHLARTGTGRQYDVGSLYGLFRTVGSFHLDRTFPAEPSAAVDDLDSVLLHQERYALAHRIGHSPAAFDDFVERGGYLSVYLDTVTGRVFGIIVHLSAFQKGFGGNATPVQADAAQFGFFHYGGFQAVLRGLYRGHISSGAAAYYDNIVFHFLFVLM